MVNIKITIQEFIEQDFNFPLKAVIYKNMKIALQAFEQFKIENQQFFSLDKKETVFGYLRNYCIDKQFYIYDNYAPIEKEVEEEAIVSLKNSLLEESNKLDRLGD